MWLDLVPRKIPAWLTLDSSILYVAAGKVPGTREPAFFPWSSGTHSMRQYGRKGGAFSDSFVVSFVYIHAFARKFWPKNLQQAT